MIYRTLILLAFNFILIACAHRETVPYSNPTPEQYRAAGKGDLKTLESVNEYQMKGSTIHGTTLLMVAARRSQPAAVRYLLSRNSDPKAIDEHKQSVMHYALPTRNREIINLLLAAGADPTVEDVFGVTPLISWAEDGMYDVMLTALEHKADWCCYEKTKVELHNILNATKKEKKYIPPSFFLVLKDLE